MSHLEQCKRTGEWCGYCYSGLRGRRAYAGHYGYRPPRRKEKPWMALARSRASRPSPLKGGSRQDSLTGYWASLPNVVDFLSLSAWDDGTSRSCGTMLIFQEDGWWKAWCNDKDAARTCFVSAETLPSLLEKVERILGGDGGDWRPAKPVGKKRP